MQLGLLVFREFSEIVSSHELCPMSGNLCAYVLEFVKIAN